MPPLLRSTILAFSSAERPRFGLAASLPLQRGVLASILAEGGGGAAPAPAGGGGMGVGRVAGVGSRGGGGGSEQERRKGISEPIDGVGWASTQRVSDWEAQAITLENCGFSIALYCRAVICFNMSGKGGD